MSSSVDHERITQVKDTVGQMRLLHAELLDQVALLEREQIAQHVGYPSTARLLVDALHLNPGQAAKLVLHAGLVTETLTPTGHTTPAPLPHIRAALHDGAVDPAHLDAIVATVKQIPDWVDLETRELVEETLADTARAEAPCVVRRQGEILLDRIDQDGANPHADKQQAEPGNLFRFHRVRGGGMKLTAVLDPETAELLETLLDKEGQPQSPAPGVPDPRSIAERHGDALSEIIHRAANPKGGLRAQLIVTMDINDLLHGIGTATLGSGCALSPGAVRRLACTAEVIPVVFNGHSIPMDLGRTRRLVTPRQRALLLARDKGCAYPGCCAPARWAEAHHIKHWLQGGLTNLDNLVLLCRRHHRSLHESEWQVRMAHGRPEFIPPKWIDPQQRPMVNTIHQPLRP